MCLKGYPYVITYGEWPIIIAIRWRRDRSVVERCSMTRGASTAAGGACLTDRTIMPALPMPYNGGRVVFASRASSPDEGRDAHAK
jgi:hypothetical protein